MNFSFSSLFCLSLLCLGTGFISGTLFQRLISPVLVDEHLPSDLKNYLQYVEDKLRLNGKQHNDLTLLLFHYEKQRQTLLSDSLHLIESDLADLDERFYTLLYSRILNTAQRKKFNDLKTGESLFSSQVTR
jgi:argonaute-like protein implicated in RNA metabolism and viral defense